MSDRFFTLIAREGERGINVTAAASVGVWCDLHARLVLCGADIVSEPTMAFGSRSATFFFPHVRGSVVSPEGFELEAFMRRLFTGLSYFEGSGASDGEA